MPITVGIKSNIIIATRNKPERNKNVSITQCWDLLSTGAILAPYM